MRRAYDAQFLLSTGTDYPEFEEELRQAIADGSAGLKGADPLKWLWDDTVAEMEDWEGFSEEYRREREDESDEEGVDEALAELLAGAKRDIPQVNPYRHVGRNDPCPCGSGLKFKRCHGKS